MIYKLSKYLLNVIFFLLIIVALIVISSFLPIKNNFKILTVLSGSMEPGIHTGSLIFIKPSQYEVGDVITRKSQEAGDIVTHRISAVDENNGEFIYKTKGDANNVDDGIDVKSNDILGEVFLNIPYLGYLINFMKTTEGIIFIIIIPTTIIVYEELKKIKAEMVNIFKKRSEKEEPVEE